MTALAISFARAAGQLADPAIVKVLGKSILATVAIFLVAGFALWRGVAALIDGRAAQYSDEIGGLVAAMLVVIGGWLLFRIVALAVIQFFADEIVAAVERRHYPRAAAGAHDLPFFESLGESMRGAGRALLANLVVLPVALALLVTGVGTVLLFWVVNAWLLGRELQDLAWLRHRHARGDAAPVTGPARFMLGGVVAGMLAVPGLNLLAPVIGAAAATHLVQGKRTAHA